MGDAHWLYLITDGTKSCLSYSSFRVGPASSNYQLSISGYKGIASSDPISVSSLNGRPLQWQLGFKLCNK